VQGVVFGEGVPRSDRLSRYDREVSMSRPQPRHPMAKRIARRVSRPAPGLEVVPVLSQRPPLGSRPR